MLRSGEPGDGRCERLREYERLMGLEIEHVDRLIHGCYATRRRFDLMAPFSMGYFAGATFSEHRRRRGEHTEGDGFLMAGDTLFTAAVDQAYHAACRLARSSDPTNEMTRTFHDEVAALLKSYDPAGLFDSDKPRMIPFG